MGSRSVVGLVVTLVLAVVYVQGATIDYCEVLHKSLLFYEAQRSGRLPANNRIPWRGNSALKDSTPGGTLDSNGDGNLAGGYYDAGDGVKFGLPAAWSLTVLAWGLIEFKSAVVACNEYDYYLDALKWGLDWWIKAHPSANVLWGQVGNGGLDHAWWGPPENMTMDRPAYGLDTSKGGTELAMEVAAAFAAGSIVFSDAGNTAYANTLKTHATQLWSFGDTYRTTYTSSIPDAGSYYNSWSGFNDELAWGSAWLYYATKTTSYLTRAESDYSTYDMVGKSNSNSFDWDNKAPGVIVLLYKLTGKSTYSTAANNWLKWWKPGGVSYTPGGLAWIREWGPNRYAASTAFLSAVYNGVSGDLSWTASQINYMLGNNPQGRSFVVGYGPNSPINPHHRAAHGSSSNDINNPTNNRNLLVGALVGGPSQSDGYVDSRTDYVKNEVALDYNAGFTAAVAALAGKYPNGFNGTQPSTSSSSSSTSTSTSATASSSSGSCGGGTAAASGCSGIKVVLNQGVNQYWFAINNPVYGVAAAVQTIEVQGSGSSTWSTMAYESWGAWTISTQLSLPVSLRINLCNGVSHVLRGVVTAFTPNAGFCGVPSGSTTGAAATTSTTTSTSVKASTTTTTAKVSTTTTTGSAAATTSTSVKASTTTTTAKVSTTTTTGSASTTGTSTKPNIVVYTDSVQNGFVSWSWATVNLDYTSNTRGGSSKTISFTINTAWGALYFYKDDGINTNDIKGVEFYIRLASAGTAKSLKVNVISYNGSSNVVGESHVISASSITTTYSRVYMDFDAKLVPRGVYDGFWVQDDIGGTHSTYLVDDIILIGR